MSTIINGTTDAITFPDATIQNTSAIVGGKVPYTNLPAGSVLQVVSATTAVQASTTSTSFVTTGFSATITPKFSTSKILVMVQTTSAQSGSNQNIQTIYRNGTTNIGQSIYGLSIFSASGSYDTNTSLLGFDSPVSTSATTYAVYFRTNTGTCYFGEGSTQTTMIVMEIAG